MPYYPGVPETQPPGPPLRPGGVAPEVQLAIRIAATAAGVGEIGWSKVFLTPDYGPRVRIGTILTDAELDHTLGLLLLREGGGLEIHATAAARETARRTMEDVRAAIKLA